VPAESHFKKQLAIYHFLKLYRPLLIRVCTRGDLRAYRARLDLWLTTGGAKISLYGLPAGIDASVACSALAFLSMPLLATGSVYSNGALGIGVSGVSSIGTAGMLRMNGRSSDMAALVTGDLVQPHTCINCAPINGSGLLCKRTLSGLDLRFTSGLLGFWAIGSDSIEMWAAPSTGAGCCGAAVACSRRLRSCLRGLCVVDLQAVHGVRHHR